MSKDDKLLKDAKKLPWEDRLLPKNWKVRIDANIDLAALCDSITDSKDPRIRGFAHLFKKTVSNSNALVQDKALDALVAYLKAADADVGRGAKDGGEGTNGVYALGGVGVRGCIPESLVQRLCHQREY